MAIGPGVHIYGVNHDYTVRDKWMKNSYRYPNKNVVIEEDVWIGANAIILPEVTVGKGSVIGAGAVVTKDIPPYSIYTGISERKLRKRFEIS